MKKITVCIGLFDKDSKKQEISTLDAFKICENIFTEYCEGATITEGKGIYKDSKGHTVIEPTLVCFVYTQSVANVKAAADILKAVLNQECVSIEVQEITQEFY